MMATRGSIPGMIGTFPFRDVEAWNSIIEIRLENTTAEEKTAESDSDLRVFHCGFWYNLEFFKGAMPVHNVKYETELHVITPNEPGILGRVLGTLANAGVNLRALNAYAEQDRGVFHLVTSDNKKAEKSLKALGYAVESREVVTVMIDDRIGAGAEIGALLGNAVIDVDYVYCSSSGSGNVLMVIQTNDNAKTFETLR